jgi:hypothetical protein
LLPQISLVAPSNIPCCSLKYPLFAPSSIPHTWPSLYNVTEFCVAVQSGISCLIIAAKTGHLEIVKYLCSLGNKKIMEHRDNNSKSAVDHAQTLHHEDIVVYLKSVDFEA